MTPAIASFVPQPGGPRLNLDDAGGEGSPVLFQHGLCGDARQTAEVFPHDIGFRRLTLEARGHGLSEAGDAACFSIKTFAVDSIHFIEHVGLAPVITGGISMGAAMAMRIAVIRPDLVRGLIIARPAWSLSAAPVNMAPNAEVGRLLATLPREKARNRFAVSATARGLAETAPDNLASLMGFFTREPQNVTASLLSAISADGPGVTAAQLESIHAPTLVIATDLDEIHPLQHASELASLIPGAELVRITPKSVDRAAYVTEFRATLAHFLKGRFA